MNKHNFIIRFLFIFLVFSCHTTVFSDENFEHLFSHANNCFRRNDFEHAITYYQKALAINPRCYQAYFNCALSFSQKNRIEEAINYYQHATRLHPGYVKAYVYLAKAYQTIKKYNEAEESYKKALEIDPNYSDAHLCLARMLHERNKFAQAEIHFSNAITLQPENVSILLDYANSLNMNNKTEKALEIYNRIIEIQPHNIAVLYNIAYSLKKIGRIDEAMKLYKKALSIKPDYVEAHFGKSLAHLIQGEFKEGWPEYEWRWKRDDKKPRTLTQPQWNGSDLQGKTILLHAEQGLGDTIQFIRYARILKNMGATVIFASQSPLVKLLQTGCPYIDKVIALHDQLPYFDTHAPLLSLPYILNTVEESIPNNIPYIYIDEELERYWQKQLAHDTNFKIGICWQGNPDYTTHFLRTTVAAKSLNVKMFEPIMRMPGVSVYSLQRMTGTEQIKHLSSDCTLITFDDDFDNKNKEGRFRDTAAVMKNLNLVISVDTSTAHLAGALGVPTWILIPEPPDWRWMLHRTDTPWYPNNMRLFRQPAIGDWTSVIEKIVDELQGYITTTQSKQTEYNQSHDINQALPITAEISIGELIDKITILHIKNEKIKDRQKLKNIRTELTSLTKTHKEHVPQSDELTSLTEMLLDINGKLWILEDDIRDKERINTFDEKFIELARGIYYTNDERGRIKRAINELCGSHLIEEKQYAHY